MGTTLSRLKNDNATARRRERRSLARENGNRVNVGRGERLVSTVLGGLLAVYGLKRRGRAGYGLAAVGAELLYRGATGHCHAYGALGVTTEQERTIGAVADVDHSKSVDVRHSIEIERPRDELFAAWRNFSNLPTFMTHLDRVDVLSNTKSHWVTKGPAGIKVEWDAEIVDEREGEWIAWQAVEPAQVPNNGTVMFRDAPSGDTEIFVTLEAQPPAGKLGELVARMFGKSPDRQVRMALEKFKEMAESGHTWGSTSATTTDAAAHHDGNGAGDEARS
ncbi:MAG TPA: SRPBCC family protein [Gemmatimonas sp.]|nr:SRPBCC family protein [Gemmatimonas sp.]